MPEFIAHKGQIAFAAQGGGDQPQHFMQRDSPVNDHVFLGFFHPPVHFLVTQPEHQRFVAYQRLIMGFAVANDLFLWSANGQLVVDLIQIPVFVRGFLQKPDPHIRLAHSQTVVKADAPLGDRNTHTGHGRHILSDQNGIFIHLPRQLCRQLQIGHRLCVRIHRKILFIRIEAGTQTVIQIQHGGHTVKPETVKVILRLPVFQIRQKEVDHFIFSVIKAFRAPSAVLALRSFMEKLAGSAVKFIDALPGILAGMGMYHIQKHRDPHFMGSIHQLFQLLRHAEPRGCGEKVGHLIAKAGIIGMLHDRHDLNGIVAQFFYPGQDILPEFFVRADLSFLLRHTDVAFVDI